jgi:outer membrane protein TolC
MPHRPKLLVELTILFAVPVPMGMAQEAGGLGLAECLAIAEARQPALAAQRASLAAAERARQALAELRTPTVLARDLPARRQQAELGVAAAQARLAVTEREVAYAVTRTWLTAVYALQQQQALENVLEELKVLQADLAQAPDPKKITPRHLEALRVFVQVIDSRLEEARQGSRRARAALREAIGLEPGCPVELADCRLPEVTTDISREQVVELALARRGELAQAGLGAQLTGLEVQAQAGQRKATGRTFASGADIHVQEVPQGSHDGDYRPGAVGMEMPPMLAGSRPCRVARVQALHARMEAVVDKTSQLIALEAEDAWRRWTVSVQNALHLKRGAAQASQLARDLRDDFGVGVGRIKVEDLIQAEAMAAQLGTQATEAHFQSLLHLASLERITGGGFCAGFFTPQQAR